MNAAVGDDFLVSNAQLQTVDLKNTALTRTGQRFIERAVALKSLQLPDCFPDRERTTRDVLEMNPLAATSTLAPNPVCSSTRPPNPFASTPLPSSVRDKINFQHNKWKSEAPVPANPCAIAPVLSSSTPANRCASKFYILFVKKCHFSDGIRFFSLSLFI